MLEREVDPRVAGDGAAAFDVGNTVRVKNDPSDRQEAAAEAPARDADVAEFRLTVCDAAGKAHTNTARTKSKRLIISYFLRVSGT